MASIGGLGSTGTSLSGLSGYGGLASGLDRDELIKNMTAATRSKIAAKQQSKTKLSWQQETMRGITSKMYQLSNKYMSYASSSNLMGSKLFSRNSITAQGANSKYVSVSGTAAGAESISVLGVRQMARNAQLTTTKDASSAEIQTGEMFNDLNKPTDVNLVSGERIYIRYGNTDYSVTLEDKTGSDYKTAESAAAAINKALENVVIGSGKDTKKLSDVMTVETNTGSMVFKKKGTDESGNELRLMGGSGGVLKNLGFMKEGENINDLSDARTVITDSGLTGLEVPKLEEPQSLAKQLGGKSISFNYNGTVSWIKLPTEDELKDKTLTDLQKDLQTKLDTAFGAGRVKAQLDPPDPTTATERSLIFTTTKPKIETAEGENKGKIVPGDPDTTSVLSITAAEKGILGNTGLFGMEAGVSNRLNLNASLKNSGLDGIKSYTGDTSLSINGESITVTMDDSIKSIMDKINNSKAGVTVSYQQNTDRFIISAKGAGASGQVSVDGDLGKFLFGKDDTEHNIEDGQDAIIAVKYPGSDKVVEIERGSNTFTVDGLNITVKGQFGYDAGADGIEDLDLTSEAVTFDAKVDSEGTTKTVKEMIDAFNEMLELVNTELNQKPDRDYFPLTDEQKEGMSESQIEKWEKEAKKGLFFNDSDLRSLSDNLRLVLPSTDKAALSKIGITISTDYKDRGKLVFDETKFKAALDTDPDAVKDLFTKPVETNADGTKTEGGVMVKMKTIMDRYAGTTGSTKGILIERAGSVYAPTSILKNSMQKQMDSLDDVIDNLKDRLATEQDRYVRQFTSLETAISQMNSQSSWLSQFGGTQ